MFLELCAYPPCPLIYVPPSCAGVRRTRARLPPAFICPSQEDVLAALEGGEATLGGVVMGRQLVQFDGVHPPNAATKR